MHNSFDLASDYLSFLLTKPPQILWITCLLSLGRILPLFCIVPFLGSKLLPAPIKICLATAFLFLCLPIVIYNISDSKVTMDWIFMLLLIKEVLIGSFFAFVVAFPFYAAQSSGAFISNQKGIQGLEGAASPLSMETTSPTAILFHNIATIAFWTCGGPIILIKILTISFSTIPITSFVPKAFMNMQQPFWITIISLCQTCLLATIQLGAPSILAMLLSDLFLGIVNRTAPQVQVIYLLSALKAFMGLLFLWLAWWLIFQQIDDYIFNWLDKLETFFISIH